MATRIQVTDVKYYRELVNNQDFLTNTGDFSDHLLGQVGDRQRAEFTIEVSNTFSMGRYDIVGGDTIILKDGQNFLTEDFYSGGKAYLSQVGTGKLNYEFDIVTISTDGSELVATNIVEQDNAGTSTGQVILPDGSYGDDKSDILRSLDESNGLVTRFGFVPNAGTISYVSPLDNVIQAYKFDGLRPGGAPGPVITGSWDSAVQGSNTGQMTAQFIDVIEDNGVIKEGVVGSTAKIDSIQEFTIIQDFIIPYYQQGDFEDTQNQTPTEWIETGLRHVLEFEFRQNLSNPNVSQFGEYNSAKGNVRWYNDNYIDIDQQYSVSDVVLTVGGETVTQINASETTTINCSINSANGTFLTTDPVLLEHSYLPNSDQYAAQTDIFTDVWLRETLRNEIDAAAANGSIITNFTAALDSANKIDIQFDVAFTVSQQTRIQDGYNYELSIKVADSSLTVPFSDVAKLIINANQYTLNTDISGLATFDQSYFYTRPMMYPIVSPGDRFTSARAWIQDGLLYDWYLNLNVDDEAVLEALTLRLVAFNTLENTWFELDNYNYDLGGQVVTAGPPSIQNIEIDKTRGYDLADGDKLNYARVQTGTYGSPYQPYTGQTAFRLSWQDWISLPNADTIFYNPAEPNNGLNKNSSHYSLANNYVICVLIDARISKNVDGTDVITQYINRSANIEVYDFDEQDGSPITWAGVIQTFDEGGADLGGQLLTEGITEIKGTFVPDMVVSDPSLYWGEIRLERINNPGDDYFVLSTLQAGAENNPLQAPTGSTYAKIDVVSGNVEVNVNLDPSLLPDAGPWNPSVRFGLIDQSIPVVPIVEVSIDGNTRQTTGDFIVFQQTEVMAAATLVDQMFSLSEAVTPGTPPGWQFKVSPTNAEPGGDAYDKSNWGAIGYIDFTTLASTLGANGDRWVYVEADDSTKIDEGFQIKYEKPQVGQNSSVIAKVIPTNGIDVDGVIYFDDPVTFNSVMFTGGQTDLMLKIQVDTPTNEDWTDLGLWGTDIDLVSLNAITSAYPDGTKWALHYGVIKADLDLFACTVTFDFDYNHSTDDKEKSINVYQNDINPDYKTQLVDAIAWDTADTVYAETDATDAALLSLLDWTNPFSIVFIGQLREGGQGSNTFTTLLGAPQSGAASSDGAGCSFSWTNDNAKAFLNVQGQTSGRKQVRFDPPNNHWPDDRRSIIILTYDGGQDITQGHNLYVNGIKVRDVDKTVSPNQTLVGAIQPSGGQYYHNRLQGITRNVNQSERLDVYNVELSAEDVRNIQNDPDAGRNAVVSGLFRSWDFGNAAGSSVPETEGSTKPMTMVAGNGSDPIPTPTSFY